MALSWKISALQSGGSWDVLSIKFGPNAEVFILVSVADVRNESEPERGKQKTTFLRIASVWLTPV